MDTTQLSIAAAAQELRTAAFSATDLAEAYLARIDEHDSRLNAFLYCDRDDVLRQARASQAFISGGRARSPLEGIPIAIKDNVDVAGWPTTNGTGHRYIAGQDAALVTCLRQAGAVLVGKLNMHEAALGGTTDNPHHGPCHNPWRSGFTPGGSSGGSAAAVSAHLCAGAVGSDTMGSIRLPASYCAVVGFKPSRGQISTMGTRALCYELDTFGPMTRTVGDAALMARQMATYDATDPGAVRHRPISTHQPLDNLAGLRVATIANFSQVEIDPDVAISFESAYALIRGLGAESSAVKISGYDPSTARRAGLLLVESDGSIANRDIREASSGAVSEALAQFLDYGANVSGARLAAARRTVIEAGHALHQVFKTVDVLLCPTTAQTAFAFGDRPPVNQADITALANFGGCPAISIPCGVAANGLPIGLQMVGTYGEDERLLDIAATVERALAFEHVPPSN